MMSSKELYLAEHERLTALAEDGGMDWTAAYESTADAAWDAARDRFADAVDFARDQAKDRLLAADTLFVQHRAGFAEDQVAEVERALEGARKRVGGKAA